MTHPNTTWMIFEQPLNEAMRACLRMEHCFAQADQALSLPSEHTPRAIATLVDLMQAIDRPDLKSKLSASIQQHIIYLQRLSSHPGIEASALEALLEDALHHLEQLREQDNLGLKLKQHPFLRSLRQQASTPGGICDFSLPVYQMWRQCNPEEGHAQCLAWLQTLQPLRDIVDWILHFSRQAQPWQNQTTHNGFFKHNLDAQLDWQLVRVAIPQDLHTFPQMSIGKHGLAIHFLSALIDTDDFSQQTVQHVRFRFACHRL